LIRKIRLASKRLRHQVATGDAAAVAATSDMAWTALRSGGEWTATTIDLHVHYVRPVRLGRVTTTAKVINLGSRIAFVEGRLFDHEGRLAATATASAMLVNSGQAEARPRSGAER
jgi:uncharacterized protein (TIGR00369 family)